MAFIFIIFFWFKSKTFIQFHSFTGILRVYIISWFTLFEYLFSAFFQLERCYLRNTTRCLGSGYSCSPTPWFFSQQSRSLFLKLFMNSVCIGHTVDVQNLNLLSTCIEMVIVCCRKPLVSGYYKLLAVSMKIANKLNYFQVRIKLAPVLALWCLKLLNFV